MITISRQFTLSGGNGPYTYSFSGPDSCVKFNPVTGTTNGSISVAITFEDEQCFSNQPLTLTAINAEGCETQETFTVNNPCSSFEAASIQQLDDYKFMITAAAPGCAKINIGWGYNTLLFDATTTNTSFSSTITLIPKTAAIQNFPDTSLLQVEITSCRGCKAFKSLSFPICKLKPVTINTGLFCITFNNGTTFYTSPRIELPLPKGCSSNVNWPSVTFNLPSGWIAARSSSLYDAWYFQAPSTTAPGVYTGSYQVEDNYGFKSDNGVLNFTVIPCKSPVKLSIPNQVTNINCDEVSPGDVISIPIDSLVTAAVDSTIDWSTWQILDSPEYESPSIVTTTNISGQHIIQYTVPDPIVNDVFAWTVCDTAGNCAEAAFFTITACTDAPVAVNDTACTICGTPIIIDVLANDTSSYPLVKDSVTIVTQPSYGWINVLPNGTIQYTPISNYEGTDSFTYTVDNVFGQTSNAAAVTISVACAGLSNTINLCTN